jgi:hypothetical protein
VGVACADLDVETAAYRSLGYTPEREDFVDQAQGVQGRFLFGGGPRLELLVSLPGSNVLEPWTSRGVRMYHIAYETRSLTEDIERLKRVRGRVVSPPTPAVVFSGRAVAFIVLPTLQLVELIAADD